MSGAAGSYVKFSEVCCWISKASGHFNIRLYLFFWGVISSDIELGIPKSHLKNQRDFEECSISNTRVVKSTKTV